MTYTIAPHGSHWSLSLPNGAHALFVARADAESEGQRLSERAAHPPIAWIRSSALSSGEYVIPVGSQPTACASCGASIVWARTPQGAAVPLSLATARTVGGRRVATTHFATCPDANEWSQG
jgi:hypothetical protein